MRIQQISRSLSSYNPPREFQITEDEFMKVINILDDYEWNKKRFESPEGKRDLIVGNFKKEKRIVFRFTFINGKIRISYDGKASDQIVLGCNKLAEKFNAFIFCGINLEYPKSKIIAAKKRLARKMKETEPAIEYQKESFGGNNMWLAIRSDLNRVKSYFNLEGKETEWQKGIDAMSICEGIFMYEFRSWVFLAGQNLGSLFAPYPKGEKAIETYQVEQLKDWGKEFNDIQLYMHYNRSMYFNAFYRVLNGRLVYGEYETESYQKKYGKIPKELKELPDNNANTVAMKWSYDPDYLRYQKELENAKTWIVTVKKIS